MMKLVFLPVVDIDFARFSGQDDTVFVDLDT